MQKSEQINELATSLSIVQSKLEGAKMDATNPFFKSKYATLYSVWVACRQTLTDNGLSVVQTCSIGDNEGLVVDTTLLHTSGQWISGELAIKPVKNDPQGVGSAITYARRYGLAAIVGICPEDDDAESAMERKPTTKEGEPKATAAQLKKIYATGKEKGYSDELAISIMVREFGTGHSKELTKKQASEFIEILTEGKYLEEAKGETNNDSKVSDGSESEERTTGSPSGEALELLPGETERVKGFLEQLVEHGITSPRLFLDVEYAIPQDEVLTDKKCEALYKTIKTKMKW